MRAVRTMIVAIASVAVVVAVVMLANVGTGSGGLQVPPTTPMPLVGNAVVTAAPVTPLVVHGASAHGFTILAQP